MPISKDNPFPGMNPFFQVHWGDALLSLLVSIDDTLNENLPADLFAQIEGRILLDDGRELRWERMDLPADGSVPGFEERVPERWVEIRGPDDKLVTVIDLLNPSNKTLEGVKTYRERQRHFLAGGIRLVEIDLIRGGDHHALAYPPDGYIRPPGVPYLVCTTRLNEDGHSQRHELYPCPLREPLPVIRIPLRRGEPDVPLALQPLVDRVYRTGRYWLSLANPAARELRPPATDAAEADWVVERLRAAGLG